MGVLKRTSHVVPAADLPLEARYQVLEQARWLAEMGALTDPNIKDHDYVLRPLNGDDVGLAGHGWNEQVSRIAGTGNTYEDSAINIGANAVARQERFIVIYGVNVASSWDSVAGVRFVIGGARTHQWDFQALLVDENRLQSRENRTLYVYPPPADELGINWIDPPQIPSRTSFLIQQYVRGGSAVGVQPSELVFLGWVAEPVSSGGGGLYGGA